MNLKKIVHVLSAILVAIIVFTLPINLSNITEHQFNLKPVQLRYLLDLTDDQAIEASITSYFVNRDNEPNEYKIVNLKIIQMEYKISITLQDIHEVKGTPLENQTKALKIRFFIASFVDYSKPNIETHIIGWIDEHRKVQEWDGFTVITLQDIP